MRTYPFTTDNGAGESLTFLRVPGENGDRLVGQNRMKPGGAVPMHVHYKQEEVFTVREGRMGYQTQGGEQRFASAGETVVFGPGEAHRFWNAGESDLVSDGSLYPVHNIEFVLSALFESTKRNGGRPGIFDVAYLMTRYRSEFGMLAVPQPVQRILFPVLVKVGAAMGRYARYADAPEPV